MRNVYLSRKTSRHGLLTLALLFSSTTPFSTHADELTDDVFDFNVQATKYQDEVIGIFGVDMAFSDNVTLNVEVDTDRYIQLGASYDWMLGRHYFDVYGQYGFDDTIDIYDAGFMYGYAASSSLFLYLDTYYQWRDSSKAIELPEFADHANHRQEWKNTLGVSYAVHPLLDVAASYHVDVLTSEHGFESSTRNSYDISATANLPYVQPYVKYTKGQYRVRPGRPVEDSSNVEVGIYLDF